MKTLVVASFSTFALVAPGAAESVRPGVVRTQGTCSYLEFIAPSVAREAVLAAAAAATREADQEVLAMIEGKIIVRARRSDDPACASLVERGAWIPVEIIFIANKKVLPLRIPMEPRIGTLPEALGGDWPSSDGIGLVHVDAFRAALSKGKFTVHLYSKREGDKVRQSGGSEYSWSAKDTKTLFIARSADDLK